jgi:hypothetical protein
LNLAENTIALLAFIAAVISFICLPGGSSGAVGKVTVGGTTTGVGVATGGVVGLGVAIAGATAAGGEAGTAGSENTVPLVATSILAVNAVTTRNTDVFNEISFWQRRRLSSYSGILSA